MAGEDEDYGSGRITIALDDVGVVADAQELAARISRALDRGTRTVGEQIRRNIQRGLDAAAVSVDVEPDLSRFDSRLMSGLSSLQSINIPVAPDLTGFEARLRAALAGVEIPIRVVPDLDDFDARIRAHRPPDVTANVIPDVNHAAFSRAMAGLAGIAGRVGGALAGLLQFGAVGIAAAAAAQGVVALGAALAPAAGIVAALPAVIAGGVVAMQTLKLATKGVSDALSAAVSGDAAKFAKAIEDLSPAARTAVTAVRDLAPELKKVQQSVQESFFKQFAGDVKGAITNLLPLRKGLKGVAAQFGKAASEGLKFAASEQALAPLQAIVKGTRAAAKGLSVAVAPLAKGFLDVAAAVATAFGPGLGRSIGEIGARIGTSLSEFAASDRAVEMVRGAIAVFKQLGAIAGNVGGILKGMFRAAGDVGGGLLNNIETITASFRAFVASTSGQQALGNIFGTVATVAAQLGPIVSALVTQLGAIAPALAPVFVALGPAITALINAIGPGLAQIVPSLAAVGAAMTDAFTGVDLTGIAGSIGSVFTSLAPALPPLVDGLASLAVSAGDLVEVLAPAATLLLQLLGHVAEYGAPVIIAATATFFLARAFLAAKAAILAIRAAWIALSFAFAASPIGLIVLAVIGLATAVYLAYQRFEGFRNVVDAVGSAIKTGFLAAVDFIVGLPGQIGGALSAFGSTVSSFFTGLWSGVTSGVSSGIDSVVAFFTGLPERAGSALTSFGSMLSTFFVGAFEQAKQAVQSGIDAVVGFFVALPGRIVAGLAVLGQLLLAGIKAALYYTVYGATLAVLGLVLVFTQLPGKIMAGLSMLGTLLLTSFTAAVTAVTTWLTTAFTATVAFFAALPGRIAVGLFTLGSTLRTAFVTAWTAVTTWVTSAFAAFVGFWSALPSRVAAAFGALRSAVISVVTTAATGALARATSFGASVVSFFQGLPSRAGAALSSLGSRVAEVFNSARTRAVQAVLSMISTVSTTLRGLPSKARNALSGIGSALVTAGKQLVDGLINGIKGAAGRLVQAAGDVVGSAINAAKKKLGIASPSKVFAEIGKNTGQGFINGLTGTGAQIKAATERIAASITKAFKGRATKVDDRLVAMVQVGNKQLQKLAAQRDALAQKIADARKFATETTQAALQAFSLQALTQNMVKPTGAGIVVGLTKAVAQVKTFTAQIEALKKRGLRKDLLEQVIGLGPQAGAELANTLSKESNASLKQINSLQAQLAKSATSLGKISSDALFDAGKQAGAGLLAGLKGQQKAIEKLMLAIAKGMQKSIRTALKIKSPSRVMVRIGDQTGAGIEVGLINRMAALEGAALSVARAVVDTVSGQFSALPGRITSSLGRLSDVGPAIAPMTRRGRVGGRGEHAELLALLAKGGAVRPPATAAVSGGDSSVTHNWNITASGQDSRVLAEHLYGQMARAAGV